MLRCPTWAAGKIICGFGDGIGPKFSAGRGSGSCSFAAGNSAGAAATICF